MNAKDQFKLEKSQIFKTKDATIRERIMLYYLEDDKVALTDKEEEVRTRWDTAFSLLCSGKSPVQVTKVLRKKYNISSAQGYRDVKDCMEVFGDVHKSSKQGYRHILYEYSMQIFQLAARKGDLREMNKAVANMAMAKGLNTEDANAPDFSQLVQNNQIVINLPEETQQRIIEMTQGGVVDVTKILKLDELRDE